MGAKTRDAMSKEFASLHETDSIAEAVRRMDESGATGLPVIGDGATWRGLVLWDELIAVRDRDRSVCDLARLELALSPDDPVDFALKRLVEQRRGSLPVVEDERVIGALSQHGARTMLGLETKGHIRWRPPRFTAPMRGQAPGPSQVERWEALLLAERSTAYQLIIAAARRPLLKRVLGLPARLARRGGSTLDEREARVEAVRDTWLGRLLERRADGTVEATPSVRRRPWESPPVPPHLDGEISDALALLSGMPFEELQRRGWHLQPNHYYWPLNDLAFLRDNLHVWNESKVPSDIEWDLDGQEQLLRRTMQYAHELEDVRLTPPTRPGEFVWENGAFDGGDAYAYYGLVRDLRPRRVIEVGSGWSSLVLARALTANSEPCEVTLVEPQPDWSVLGELPESWQVLQNVVQDVDLALFEQLQSGDVLFYDGSHCVRTGSDVNWIFFEVLPRLPAGVWFHVHDIAWPSDYAVEWVFDEGLSWNEQYFLQAFLMNNSAYRVRLAMRMLSTLRADAVAPMLTARVSGASVWLEKLG